MRLREERTVKVNRREFLASIAAASLFAALGGRPMFARNLASAPFELLVVGDSLIWGQGLEEKDKFYSLIAEWLKDSAFGGPRDVDLKVKAHSGATIKFHKDEAEKYQKAGRDETFYYKPEVNVGFPSSWKQIEVASSEYRKANVKGADLVMICGGITDITTSRVFDPKGDDDALKAEIKKYCHDDMYDLLEHAKANNPDATLVVIGYFPAVSPKSSSSKLLNAWLEALSFPRPLKFAANNPLGRKIFFDKLKKRAIERSRIWVDESNRNFASAVEAINAKYGPGRAVFVRSPLTEDNAVEAPDTKLFRMGKGGVVKDAVSPSRIKDCRESLPELKRSTGIDYPVRLCEIASIGHPDPSGARLYAEAIKSAVLPILK